MAQPVEARGAERHIVRLIFVYDAPSGKVGAIADSMKKLVGKGCPLCAVTYGLVGKRGSWAVQERDLGVPVTYLHSDELADLELQEPVQLPVILAKIEGEASHLVLLDADAISRARGTQSDLKGRLAFRAASLGLSLPELAVSCSNAGTWRTCSCPT